jgi:hypothetical protein
VRRGVAEVLPRRAGVARVAACRRLRRPVGRVVLGEAGRQPADRDAAARLRPRAIAPC